MKAPRALAAQHVYPFDSGAESAVALGGKGAGLARMRRLGLPIPPGFTISTEAWRRYSNEGVGDELRHEVAAAIGSLEHELGRGFGDPEEPLLVSVRSGSPASMPGMMDTILNLGLTTATVEPFGRKTNPGFAWDVFLRLLGAFATVVRGLEPDALEAVSSADPAATAEGWKALIEQRSGRPFPETPDGQLVEAIEAVWRSWDNDRARRYRRFRGIDEAVGTAVTVQAMVFGNLGTDSGTGVVFTRDPATGSPEAYGDFLRCAQGEDVVAGGRATEPLESMRAAIPGAYGRLEEALPLLEASYRDMCDVEFTVERGTLWILQARVGQRSPAAAVRIAIDLVDDGLISPEEAIERVPLPALEGLEAPVFATGQSADELGRGIPASPGCAVGRAVFDSLRAQELEEAGHEVILVRPETSPEDIGGMIASRAIVTATGGRASHAAVVARGLGRPAVCSLSKLVVSNGSASVGGRVLQEGDILSVDGTSGLVVLGALRLVPAQPDGRIARLLSWCDEHRRAPIVREAPEGFVRTSEPGQATGADAVLVDVVWEGADSTRLLERTVEAVCAAGATRLAFVLPEQLLGADLRVPAGPWTAIVGDPENWAARLLAARIPIT